MNRLIPFEKLPESVRPEAARSLLAGGCWMYWGDTVQETDPELLRYWAARAPCATQEAAEPAGKVETAAPIIGRLTNASKRAAVDSELRRHPDRGDRELARSLGVSHRYVALRRRVIVGNVANDLRGEGVKSSEP
jgi:hypothetical protein